jgi:uncharacterized lipoprotein YajG
MAIRQQQKMKKITTMKSTRLFSRINFTLLAFVTALAGTLFFTGCATTDSSSDTRDSNQHSHH